MRIFPESEAPLISDLTIEEGRGKGYYTVRLMKEFDETYVTPEKVRDLWLASKEHDVLFSDYTEGDPKALLRALSNSSSVWFEVLRDGAPVGILYMNNIIPNFDGVGHFAFWDKIGRGREPLVIDTLKYLMQKYNLQRVTAEVPVYQKGTIRFVERLGFELEGERRNGVLYKGEWVNQLLFGILRDDLISVDIEMEPERRVG